MAAISFQDSLAYMLYNASKDDLPKIDVPKISIPNDIKAPKTTNAENKYGINTSMSHVASNPINQMFIQGVPPILIIETAPSKSRALDALACVIRSSLDEAISRQTKDPIQSSKGRIISRKRKFLERQEDAEAKDKSVTERAVNHHPDDLSCENLLTKASRLFEQDSPTLPILFGGHRLLVSALDVFLHSKKEPQFQKILDVLEKMLERPMLLSQGGPTFHLLNNCVICLARIINKFHADGLNDVFAKAQFEVALNIYNASRVVLEKHRSKLPQRLRCHEIPRPTTAAKKSNW